jgi:hypothetical protein
VDWGTWKRPTRDGKWEGYELYPYSDGQERLYYRLSEGNTPVPGGQIRNTDALQVDTAVNPLSICLNVSSRSSGSLRLAGAWKGCGFLRADRSVPKRLPPGEC